MASTLPRRLLRARAPFLSPAGGTNPGPRPSALAANTKYLARTNKSCMRAEATKSGDRPSPRILKEKRYARNCTRTDRYVVSRLAQVGRVVSANPRGKCGHCKLSLGAYWSAYEMITSNRQTQPTQQLVHVWGVATRRSGRMSNVTTATREPSAAPSKPEMKR
jgi:hypothetical protein